MFPRFHRTAVTVLCMVAVVAGCTVGPSQRPPVAVRGENMPAPPPAAPESPVDTLPEPGRQRPIIRFFDCTEAALAGLPTPPPADRTLRADCGELSVIADPDRPAGADATLGIVRVGAADAPADRPPLLVVGDSAGEPSARSAVGLAAQVSPALLQRFTLVGMDRRGAGVDALDCAPPGARAALVDADPAATAEGDLTGLLERARAVVQQCTIELDSGLTTYRSAATAADVEILRDGLGVERLSAVGVGDGAAALARWAGMVPRAVGRLVLDGPPQPGLDDPELSEARAAAAEGAFDAFALACTARVDCPLGPDPRATVTGVVQALRARPLVAADGRRLTAGAAVVAVLGGIGEPRIWPRLAAAVATAGAGDPTALLDVLEPVTGPGGRFDAMLATACNDTRRRASPGEITDLATGWRSQYPLFGGTFALRLLACAPWSTGGPTTTPGPADGAPPILVVGTVADPRAALDGSRHAADALRSGRFVTWQGAGTGAYPRSACISAIVDAMLLDGVVPQSGTLCPP